MRTLSENQIKALRLLRQGKKLAEIREITKKPASSVSEAITRGRKNIDKAIEVLQTAIEEGLLDEGQFLKLTQMLGKI